MAINLIGSGSVDASAVRHDRSPGFVASAAVLALAIAVFAWTLWAGHSRSASSDAQATLNAALSELLATVTTAQSSMRGYVLAGNDEFLAPYRQSTDAFAGNLDGVTQTLATARADGELIEVAEDNAQQAMDFFETVVATRTRTGFDDASALVTSGVGRQSMADLRSTTQDLKTASYEIIANNSRFERRLAWLQLGVFLPAIAAAVYLAMLAWRRQRQLQAGADLLGDLIGLPP